MGDRKLGTCVNCGEEREIAAHNLCFRCYRREERAAENPWAAADRHNRSKLKAQRKLRTAITAILNAVDGVIEHMDEEHVMMIRSACGHYFAGLASGLPTTPTKNTFGVNSEHEADVNCSQPQMSCREEHGDDHTTSAMKTTVAVNSELADAVNGAPSFELDEDDVNSEQVSGVNCSPNAPAETTKASEQKSLAERSQLTSAQTNPANSEQKQVVNSSQPNPSDAAELTKANRPLLRYRDYIPRPHPRGGFGVYERHSANCVQWHSTETDAWDAITAVFTSQQ